MSHSELYGQALIDALVYALWRPDSTLLAEVESAIDAIYESEAAQSEELAGEPEDSGIFITDSDIDHHLEQLEGIEEIIGAARAEELLNTGDPLALLLKEDEMRRYVERYAPDLFESDKFGWQIVRVCSTSQVDAFIARLVSGSSWEGVTYQLVGVGRTAAEAAEHLKQRGYLDADDLKTRYHPAGGTARTSSTPSTAALPDERDSDRARFLQRRSGDWITKWKRSSASADLVAQLRPLAEQGDASAQFGLGLVYDGGLEVAQDYVEAAAWYRKAAEQGNASAQHNLGAMYANGQGVVQDYVLAHMWFNLGASGVLGKDGTTARENRDRIATNLSPQLLADAQRMAREWQDAFEKRKGK